MPKCVASTLKVLLDHPIMQVVQDQSRPVRDTVKQVESWWTYDLYSRNPGPAVTEDGEFQGTDLDLACFLYALAQRGAVINLPVYEGRRAAQRREGERVVSKDNRHGGITGLTANKECFSFGIRITDFNVVQRDPRTGKETVGAPRNFMLVDVTGKWHDGWDRIEFSPTAKENDFLNDKRLWTGNSVVFKNFVHPNRWISLYGQYYFLTKALIERLENEAKFCYTEISRIQAAGIAYPPSEAPAEWPKTTQVGADKPIKVSALEVELDLPAPSGNFQSYPVTQDGLVAATKWRKELVYGVMPRLRFATRSVELAFFRHGFLSTTGVTPSPTAVDASKCGGECIVEKMPPWISDAKWERNYTPSGKRAKWNRLILFQPAPGELGVALRYRVWEKTERVAAD